MERKNKKFTAIFIVSFILSTLGFSFGALIYNIKSIPLTKQIKQLRQENQTLREDNQRLFVQLSQRISYKNIKDRAEQLGMKRASLAKIVHVQLPKRSLQSK